MDIKVSDLPSAHSFWFFAKNVKNLSFGGRKCLAGARLELA